MYVRTSQRLGQPSDVKPLSFHELSRDVENALRQRQWSRAVGLLVLSDKNFGIDRLREIENRLTDIVFFARHRERDGKRLKPGEQGYQKLRQEWLDIRNLLVRPALGYRVKGWNLTELPEPPLDPEKRLSKGDMQKLCSPLLALHATIARQRSKDLELWKQGYIDGICAECDCYRRIQRLQKASIGRTRR
jgi:hypothetical protein